MSCALCYSYTTQSPSSARLQVSRVLADFQFFDAKADYPRDDLRQKLSISSCGAQKLPLTLQHTAVNASGLGLTLNRRGFYPQGGGKALLQVPQLPAGQAMPGWLASRWARTPV